MGCVCHAELLMQRKTVICKMKGRNAKYLARIIAEWRQDIIRVRDSLDLELPDVPQERQVKTNYALTALLADTYVKFDYLECIPVAAGRPQQSGGVY